ncbi:hypothetical protein BVRB_011960 [Beta vulgaris subsp. vulgaris]|uniref:Uncharacterized protein n=1 Tax=Beta vulgaris subsp. vulgaris TaxID=3555 RepID=A0A0J8B5H3_BETVV|nr:hypothetical protein BVRB_011960 [Beta vulgaris subsp. vulgaris]
MKNKDAIIEQLTEVNRKLQAKVHQLKEKKNVSEKTNKDHELKMEAMASREKILLISCLLSMLLLFLTTRV